MKIKTKSLLQWCIDNNKQDLINEFSKSNNKSMSEINYGSNREYIWNGKCGHQFLMSPKIRIKGCNCPYCAGQKVLKGFNDFETYCKNNHLTHLLDEWDYDKNIIKPFEITSHTNKKVFWKCQFEHSWSMSPKERIKGCNCPYCANKRVLKGFNDFETWCKNNNRIDLLNEWDCTKNKYKPSEIIGGYGEKIYWICEHGHSFRKTINERKNGYNCPQCSLYTNISFNEKAVAYYVGKHFKIVENFKSEWLGQMSIDIFIPKLNTGIEYDGQKFHNNKKDEIKNKICTENNITLFRIREPKCEKLNDNNSINIILNSLNKKDLEYAIKRIIAQLGITSADVDIKRDTIDILSKVKKHNLKNSLYTYCIKNNLHHILNEWDKEKNKDITPKNITAKSEHKVYWICPNGHSYIASIHNRTKENGTNCPHCGGRKSIIGKNDLKTYCIKNNLVKLIKEWSPQNENMKTYTPFSSQKVEWICSKCGHEWITTIEKRVKRNRGCPKCARLRNGNLYDWCIKNKPFLIEEWCAKNGDMKNFAVNSQQKVYWKCRTCGYEWKTRVESRTNRDCHCPECSKQMVGSSVICIETNQLYRTISEATKSLKIHNSAISKCCRLGTQYTAGGYHWRYATEEEIQQHMKKLLDKNNT